MKTLMKLLPCVLDDVIVDLAAPVIAVPIGFPTRDVLMALAEYWASFITSRELKWATTGVYSGREENENKAAWGHLNKIATLLRDDKGLADLIADTRRKVAEARMTEPMER